MKLPYFIPLASLAMMLQSCNNGGGTTDPGPGTEDTITKYDPVETRPPNTTYEPAFEGQTRTFGIKTRTPYTVTRLSSALSSPWGIAALPDGRLLITQRFGTMVIMSADGVIDKTISGLPEVNSEGQGGLLGVCVDNNYSANRFVYWAFSENVSGGTVTSVARGVMKDDESGFDDIRIIFRAEPSYAGTLHYGGRIIMDKENNLYLTTGERSDNPIREEAQNKHAALGKVLKFTRDGTPVNTNPYFGSFGGHEALYSYGHRNVQGIAIDPISGTIYESELGPRGGDEINIIMPDKNYGWPVITYGLEYSGAPIGAGITQASGMEQPLYYWDPVISPSGMIYYHNGNIPEWNGNLLIAGLNGSHIARIRLFDGKVAGEERLLDDLGERFRDVLLHPINGSVYTVTDGGRLYRIQAE